MPLICTHTEWMDLLCTCCSRPLPFIVRVAWTHQLLCRYPLTNIRVVVAQSGFSVCRQWLPGCWWDLSTAQVELLDEEEAEQAKLSRHDIFATAEHTWFAVNGWLKRSGVKFQIRNNKIYQNLPGRGKRGVKRRARQPSGHKDHKGFGLNFTFQYQNGRILTTIVTTHYMVTYSVTAGNHYSP